MHMGPAGVKYLRDLVRALVSPEGQGGGRNDQQAEVTWRVQLLVYPKSGVEGKPPHQEGDQSGQ